MFSFKVRINFSKKIKGIRKVADIHASELSEKVQSQLTKREILSQINGFFDPMGLGAAFTVKAKMLWREMFQMQDIRFHRCIKPYGAKDVEPILILFSDASNRAYGRCAYYKMGNGGWKFTSRLVAAVSFAVYLHRCGNEFQVRTTISAEYKGWDMGRWIKNQQLELVTTINAFRYFLLEVIYPNSIHNIFMT